MTSQEKDILLDKEQAKYTYSEKDTDTSQGKKDRPSTPKNSKKPALDKVDEDMDKEKAEEKAFKAACPDYFGVKSYLHHFYDTHFYKDPNIYEEEDDEFEYLLHKPNRRRCTSVWWKVFVWIGANFLIFGIIGVLVGYLVPQRPIIVGKINEGLAIVDRKAMAFNFNLDVCKLVGLILFCIGGLTLTVALLFPSFLYQYCDDEGRRDSSFRVRMTEDDDAPRSPLEMTIPSCSMLSNVQPERKADESIVTQEGMISIKE